MCTYDDCQGLSWPSRTQTPRALLFHTGEVTSVATRRVAHNMCSKAVPREYEFRIRTVLCIGCDLRLASYYTLVHSDAVNAPLQVIKDDIFISAISAAGLRADCID